jgi:YbbR domain-containing protein
MKEHRLPIIIFSTLFAILLWVSVNMTYEYQTTVQLPLVLENIKPTRALARPVPQSVQMKVHGTGWQLAELSFAPNTRYELDCGEVTTHQRFLTANDIMERVKIPRGPSVIEIKPETLLVVLDEKISKTVPLIPNTSLSFRNGYDIIGDVHISPDSVKLAGAHSLLNDVTAWSTNLLSLSNLRSPVQTQISVSDSLSYGITPIPSKATISFDVQPIAEETFKGISVDVNDVPENRLVVLIPPKVDIIIRGGVDQLAALSRKDFSAYINYSTILLDTTGMISPTIVCPRNTKVVDQNPEKLQYVIRK